jgi:phage terminase Nu1 subunit (DNA packaging protein)
MLDDADYRDLIGDLPPAPVPSPVADDLVTALELATCLGVRDSLVTDLARNGILPRVGGSRAHRYPLRQAVRAYCDHLRKGGRGRSQTTPEMEAAKLALTEANAAKVQLQNDRAAGRLLDAQHVRAEWLALAADLRSRLLAVPGRVAARLSLDRPTAAALDREIRLAMADLAADSPETARGSGEPPDFEAGQAESTSPATLGAENGDAAVRGSYAV